MGNIKNSFEYFQLMEQRLASLEIDKFPMLLNYYQGIKDSFLDYENIALTENIFDTLSRLLRLDAKLVLLCQELEHIDMFDLKQEEIVKQIDKDSQYTNKELCGYSLNERTHVSLIFNTFDLE